MLDSPAHELSENIAIFYLKVAGDVTCQVKLQNFTIRHRWLHLVLQAISNWNKANDMVSGILLSTLRGLR